MDGKLIHVSGRVQHLFPSDGGHVTVENVSYVEGTETNVSKFHLSLQQPLSVRNFLYFW